MEVLKVEEIKKFPIPKTKAFLGITGYYHGNICQSTSIAPPLTYLTRKSELNNICWLPACDIAFRILKDVLCSTNTENS